MNTDTKSYIFSIGFGSMRRRTFTRMVATGLTGLTLSTSTAAARSNGTLPNGNVSTATVHVFGTVQDPIQVDAGSWITHYAGWLDDHGGDNTKADVDHWLDAVEFSAWIDGQPIPNAKQYFEAPALINGAWTTEWRYSTPPKSSGNHTFTTEWYYPNGYTDGTHTIRQPGERNTFTSHYEVTPKNGRP